MLSANLLVIFVIGFSCRTTFGRTPPAFSKEALELKVLLKAAIDRNHQLQVQNQRLKLIWSGLDKMCSAITSSASCQCDGQQQKKTPILEIVNNNQLKNIALLRKRIRNADKLVKKTENSVPNVKVKQAKGPIVLPPPAVEFYKHSNGNFVNAANKAANEKKTEKKPPKETVPMFTVSPSPIAAILMNSRNQSFAFDPSEFHNTCSDWLEYFSQAEHVLWNSDGFCDRLVGEYGLSLDLNLAHFVANLRGRKPTSTPKPVVDHFQHHTGVDIMHEMLNPHSHKTTKKDKVPKDKGTIVEDPFHILELEPLGPMNDKGHSAHGAHGAHSKDVYNTHQETTPAKVDHQHHTQVAGPTKEVISKPPAIDKGLNLESHMLHSDYGSVHHQTPDQGSTKLSFDLINKVNGHLLKKDKSPGIKLDPIASEMSHTGMHHMKHDPKSDMTKSNVQIKKTETTPHTVDSLQHHTGTDIMHEMLGAHNHKPSDNSSVINYVNHDHQSPTSDLNSKIVLNDLLIATEKSIQEKQMAGKNKSSTSPMLEKDPNAPLMPTDPGTVEKFIFGNDPVDPLKAFDIIPKQNEAHQHGPKKIQTKIDNKPAPPVTARGLTVTIPPKYVKLAIKSVSSEGLILNAISVTVRYTAPYDHTTEWLQLQENGATTRTSGVRTKTVELESEYTSNMVFVEANSTRHALFRLFGNDKSISLQFDLAELRLSGEQLLPDFMDDILEYNETVMAPRNMDLEINMNVRGSPSENPGLRNTEIFFTGLNTTTKPNTVFEIVHFNSEGVSVQLSPQSKTSSTMKIIIKRPYIDYGGILTVRLAQTVGGYLEGYYYGHLIRVLEFYTREVIPFGNLGVYYLPKTTLVRDPSQSILCAAMGNPPPEVVILKLAPDGTEKETLAETIMLDTVTNMKSLTLYADKPQTSEGNYICRASIGGEIVDSNTEVIVVRTPEFDKLQTGVTRNASDVVTISCKASGRPRPKMEMRLYEEHGPNLAEPGIYKTSLLTPDNSTSQLTLMLSQNNKEIHTVVCVAKQNILGSKEHYKKIVVFPKSENYTNWYLYNRLRSMTGW